MTYAQLITYISTWIYENHNNEITANILKDVLEKLAQYARDNDQEVNDEIQNLWDAINNIVISDGVEAHQGDADPNVTPPANYNTGDLYVQDLDRIWIYNGSEWVLINSGNVNISLKKIDIPIDYTGISQLLEYFNDQEPPIQKDKNENWIIQTSDGSQFFLVGVGAGRIGENYINLTEENILQISSGSGGNTHPTKTLTTTTQSLTITTDHNYYIIDAENDELEITLDLDLESDENFRAKILIKNATGFDIVGEGLRETNLSSLFDSEFDNLVTIDWFGEEGVWKCELIEENSMIYRKETHHGGFSYAAKPEAVGGQFYEFEGKMFYVAKEGRSDLMSKVALWDDDALSNDAIKTVSGDDETFDIPANHICVSRCENLEELFYNTKFNQSIENWDVSNVILMDRTFERSEFNQPIDNWDVSNVIEMWNMFMDSQFNQPIANWDVKNTTLINNMFRNNTAFIQDISTWCVEHNPAHNNFDANTNPLWTEEMKPKWGQPCN